jgi:A/G-specific adenine glycosylase
VHEALLTWFDREARPLPWREGPRDPYRTLVAEVMLQQTQAGRAADAYRRFVEAFPTVGALAEAPLERVLVLWQGLGYYRRARALHAAAATIVREHGARVPADPEQLATLSGIGTYTAVAVAAQAYGVPGIAVDANVRRVGRRLLGDGEMRDGDIARRLAAVLLDFERPTARSASVAEALIEIGATVCRPRSPRCDVCPLRRWCQGAQAGEPQRFDGERRRAAAPTECSRVLVALRGDHVALVLRPEGGRFGGLWGFPAVASDEHESLPRLAAVTHRLTHRVLEVVGLLAGGDAAPERARWAPLRSVAAGAAALPVSNLDRRVAAAALAHVETAGADRSIVEVAT